MSSCYLEITLLEDVVLSASSATAGAHESLDYLTGATLLGIAASRLYGRLNQEESFLVFHSGQFRFGSGLPSINSIPCLPAPRCWHYPKGKDYRDDYGYIKAETIHNLLHGDMEGQPKALRNGYVQPFTGAYVQPERLLRIKTAIDNETGRSAEGQLFAYEAIAARTCFVARLDWDERISQKLVSQVQEAFIGTRYFGRSRSAEYGAAELRLLDFAPPVPETLPESSTTHDLLIWCVSDLALIDHYGQYTADPQPEYVLPGLGGVLMPATSFLGHRSYAPWNAHRRCRDPERQVIQQGSVIHWHFPDGINPIQMAELQRGIGLHREAGLGQVLIQAKLLQVVHPRFIAQERAVKSSELQGKQAIPDHPLARWLTGQTLVDNAAVREGAQAWLKELQQLQSAACLYQGLGECEKIGPSTQQWGRVLDFAKNTSSFTQIRAGIFHGDNAIAKEKGEGWSEGGFLNDRFVTFYNWFNQRVSVLLEASESDIFKTRILREFAREAQHLVKNRHREIQTNTQRGSNA